MVPLGDGGRRALGKHADRGRVDEKDRVGVTLDERVVGLDSGPGDDDGFRPHRVGESVDDGLARSAASEDDDLLALEQLARRRPETLATEAGEHPCEAEHVGVLGDDGAVLGAHQGVCGTEALDGGGANVGQARRLALVGDGHVEAAPRALSDEGRQLVGLELDELIGGRAQALVDLRRPAVAEPASDEAVRRVAEALLGRAHARAPPRSCRGSGTPGRARRSSP